MATVNFSPLLVLSVILAQTAATFGLGNVAVGHAEPNPQATLDIIHARLTDYFVPFENCITMVFFQGKFSWATKRTTNGPIISLEYDIEISLVTGRMIYNKFSVLRRRNPATFCWATLAILPEKAGLLLPNEFHVFVNMPSFIYTILRSHYFIIVTGVENDVKSYLRKNIMFLRMYVAEVILVDVTKVDNSLLLFQYHNLYEIKKPVFKMEHSEEWYQIGCTPGECFDQLVLLGKNLSRLNKYFWATRGTHDANLLSGVFNKTDIWTMRNSRYAYQLITNLISFHGFFCFLILQDVLIYGLEDLTPFHYFDPMEKISMYGLGGHDFVMYDVQKYSFVSCYGIRENFEMLGALSSPFDVASWACIIILFVLVVLILSIMLRRNMSDGMFLIIAISLETSISLSAYETKFRRNKYPMYGIRTLCLVWTIFVGTIFISWYKTWFTMEMIVPTVYESPWKSVMDVEGIQVLMPFDLLAGNIINMVPQIDYFRYKMFYFDILVRCQKVWNMYTNEDHNFGERKTAEELVQKLKPHFGMDDNLRFVGNGTFSPMGSLTQPYDKSVLIDYPIQPVEYDERDSYGVTKRLQTCGKVALMDRKENIAAITNFLNDNQHHAKFVQGDGDSFFMTVRGWTIPRVRMNYVEKRLKSFISSGILTHLKVVYKLWTPSRLLGHYGNWTGPKVRPVTRLDFSSKVTTGFYVCGIGLLICFLVLLAEILKHKYVHSYFTGV
ncbi:hypothetical protein Fcan01_26537 [Folsomia candida]|uniref:Uncharacterized protein n=1 Tax=Folsomia candida TaxID=158441 RepID=A0A226D0F5_FOLCA|nr:hypothetical protein Fcan01_26537 [Folsomia candida]